MFLKILRKYVIKKRYVYSLINAQTYDKTSIDGTFEILYGDKLLESISYFENFPVYNKIYQRSKNKNTFCFVYLDENEILIGYFWAIIPKEKIWHDSIPIEHGEAF